MKSSERAALQRAIDQLGAQITVSMRPHQPMSRPALGLARYACDSHPYSSPPAYWPGDRLTGRGQVTVLATPNPDEMKLGRWGVGRPGVLLRQAINSAGLSVRDDCALVAVDHTNAHAMWQAVVAADTPHLLLVGGDALKCWRGDIRLQQVAGGMYPATLPNRLQRYVGVVQAPEMVLRTQGTLDASAWRGHIESWVAKVLESQTSESGPIDMITWSCRSWDRARERACGGHVYGWDGSGLPWCKSHLVDGWDGAEKARKQGMTEINRSLQMGWDAT